MKEKKPNGYWNYDTCKEEAKKYKKRVDFQKACSGAYNMARINGWIDEYYWFEPAKTQKKWNYETCLIEAKKYTSRSEFQKGSNQAYFVARVNGWLEEYDWFERPIVHNKKWTYNTCKEEAKKYKSRTEFGKKCGGAYYAAIRNGWIEEYEWFEENKKPSGYWTQESCMEEARKYETRTTFYRGSYGAYKAAKKNGWIKDYNWFKEILKPQGYWNYDTCKEEAKKYESRGSFQKNCVRAYNLALKKGWLDDYDWFEESKTGKKWDYDTCMQEAKKYKSRGEFQKGSNGAYSVALQNKWLNDYEWFDKIDNTYKHKRGHCIYVYVWEKEKVAYVGLTHLKQQRHRTHMTKEESPVFRYSKDNGLPIPDPIYLEDKLAFEDAQNKEDFYIQRYREQGYDMLNSKPAGSVGAYGKGKWTYDTCKEEAKKYKSRGGFSISNQSAYRVARINGWLEEYDWFVENKKPSGYWNYDTCKEEAKKYKSRGEFCVTNGSAYEVARTNGWLDDYDWFDVKSGKWTYETCLEEAKKYKTRNELRKGCVSAYDVALKNGWLDDYDWFVQNQKPSGYWTYDTCKKEAMKYTSRNEFCIKCSSAYQTAKRNGWFEDYNWFEESKTRKKWDYDSCKKEALKYQSKGDFCKGNGSAYNVARKNGWLNDYDWFEKKNGFWNYDSCMKEAKKYTTKNDFHKNSSSAYTVALKHGWLVEYNWFEVAKKKWNYDSCKDMAMKYKTRSELKKASKGAYNAARKNGWLDVFFGKLKK